MSLDPRIEAVRQQYGLDASDFWQLPQNKQWVCKHAALEVVAVKAGIRFDMPQIIEAHGGEGVAAVCVQGTMGDRFEWSIGECNPKNNRNSYPWAMAEKRAKDRVILKLTGIHGLVYSDNEIDGSEPAPMVTGQISSALAKKLFRTDVLEDAIRNAESDRRLDALDATLGQLGFLPNAWMQQFRDMVETRRDELAKGLPTQAQSANATLDRQYAETMRE